MSMDREDHEMIAALIDRTFKARTPEEIREQRRYEIARAIFAQDISFESPLEYAKKVAVRATQFADALLAELEKTK